VTTTAAATTYSPLTHDAATRRAFRDAWALRDSPYLREAIEHLLACNERAWDEELERRLELFRARVRARRRAIEALSDDKLVELLRGSAPEVAHAA
jgi:hypothetical protein